jgi:hypothetical protein
MRWVGTKSSVALRLVSGAITTLFLSEYFPTLTGFSKDACLLISLAAKCPKVQIVKIPYFVCKERDFLFIFAHLLE